MLKRKRCNGNGESEKNVKRIRLAPNTHIFRRSLRIKQRALDRNQLPSPASSIPQAGKHKRELTAEDSLPGEATRSQHHSRQGEAIHCTQAAKRKHEYSGGLNEASPKRQKLSSSPLNSIATQSSSIEHWTRVRSWPEYLFKPEEMLERLARKRSSPSLSRKRSIAGSFIFSQSDDKPREMKAAPYKDAKYEIDLKTKAVFMDIDAAGHTTLGNDTCPELLERTEMPPQHTLFSEKCFRMTCNKIRNRNEARIIQDIARLICPSVETLALHGSIKDDIFVESVNEEWSNCIPITTTRPQPDYAVGFAREAFAHAQINKIHPYAGDIDKDVSYFMATYYMYFTFLTVEIKRGNEALEIADRQNAHSMAVAVRAITELFRLIGRENELNRNILAFSISHDHRMVRLYGHFAIFGKHQTTFHRHLIRAFDFTELGGKERWTTYGFVRNIYEHWAPDHLGKILL